MQRLAASYGDPRVGVMGSHSALEVMDGAKDEGLRTAVYCQRGRDAPYRRFSRVADEVITLPRFADMASARVQRSMREAETVVVPHRSFAVYIGYSRIENSFRVPLFGNRAMLRAEERDEAKNQYDLLRRARISHPRVVEAKDISGPCIVKVQEGKRRLEPASVRESLLERVLGIGDRFVRAARSMYRPGVIGPFSLQSVVTKDLELVVYDVSMRVPGNPILATTSPYTKYTHGKTIGVGRRVAMEIVRARDAGRLADVVT